jgi:magnesium transporter
MWIPEEFDPSANYSLYPSKHGSLSAHGAIDVFSELREWRSIIGIVTAIIGNILISFALNIQRYAHIRIDREYHESNVILSKGGSSTAGNGNRAYGMAVQEQIAEERARINAKRPGPRNAKSNGKDCSREINGQEEQDAHERSPLLRAHNSDSTFTTLEKHSDDGETRKSYLRSPYWWAGIILMTVGEAGNFLAYGFAPASIVSPLGVVALVSNCVVAPFLLKEPFRMRDGWGVLVAIAGAVTIVLSAKNSETKFGQDELWDAILRWEFLTYVGITTSAIIVLIFASPKYGDRTILIDLGLVGLFGGYTALSTKGVASLLSDTLWRALTFPITYFLIAILVLSALMQIRYVNRSLQRFNSTQVIPTQFVLFTISVIIGSAVLYRDFESTTAVRAAKFVGGCLLTFCGVYLITSGPRQDSDEEERSITDEEEGIHLIDEEADPRQQTRESNNSSRRTVTRPRTPDREYSDPATATTSPVEQTPYTPTPFAFPSTTHPNLFETSDPWASSREHVAGRTQESPAQPSPFTRAQSNPPQTPTFARLRPTQSSQQTPATPTATHLYLRSPSTPAAIGLPTPTPRSQGTSPTRAAEAALRAHLAPTSPSPGEQGPAVPTSGYGHGYPYPSLNRAPRGSFGRLLPGPLLSPLSSGLSAVVAESLRRGEGGGSVAGLGIAGTGRSRGRLSSVRRKNSSRNRRPALAAGMVSDGMVRDGGGGDPGVLEGLVAQGGGGGRGVLAGFEQQQQQEEEEEEEDEEEEAQAGNEVGEAVGDGEDSVEAKRGKLQAMSESLGELVERRRGKKGSSSSSHDGASQISLSPRRDHDHESTP